MRITEIQPKLGTTFLLLVLVFIPIRATAQHSVQPPTCEGVIYGVVSDDRGQPVRGFWVAAELTIFSGSFVVPRAQTDEAGRYRLERLCPRKYAVYPDDEEKGYPDIGAATFELLYGRHPPEVRLTSKHLSAELALQLPPKPGLIHIRATDQTNHFEIKTFEATVIVPRQRHFPKVEFSSSPQAANLDIPVPPDKDFVLRVNADGFHEWSPGVGGNKLIHVPAGGHISLEAQLQPLR